MANDVDKIAELRDLSEFLFDLAVAVPEHCSMLFRLSDKVQAEAEKLERDLLPLAAENRPA